MKIQLYNTWPDAETMMGEPYCTDSWPILATLMIFASLLCGLPEGTLAEDNGKESAQLKMEWIQVSNTTALCNDYTPAGFFIRQNFNLSSNNWVVFLESGGLCYNSESCNRRFFIRKVR